VLLGFDLPLWRLLSDASPRAPRAFDPALHPAEALDELYDHWTDGADVAMTVAVRPLLDGWEGVAGSRAVDLARRFDAPVVLAIDARERGASAAAAVYGARALAPKVEFGGVILVGADDSPAGAELLATLRREVGLPVLGRIPPQLTEQFLRQYGTGTAGVRALGPRPGASSLAQLCREAATYLSMDEVFEIAARRGFVPSPPRRLLLPDPAAAGLSLAVGWGPPLQPLPLENTDILQAAGVRLLPLNVAQDAALPDGADGVLLLGAVDEDGLSAYAANAGLHGALREAVDRGLPVLALGGAALLLLQRLADSRGRSHELAGVVPAEAELIEWYDRPHYVQAKATRANPYAEGDLRLFELFDLEFLVLEADVFAYHVRMPDGTEMTEGFVVGRCLASTLFASFAGAPGLVQRFVAALRAARGA
jgi:cobyrinic acid a,c-diamide synthase